jgi:hypothetical protein
MLDIVLKYNMLDENARKQLNDFIDFLLSKHKKSEPDFLEYYDRIQTVSQWSEADVEYLREIENNYNWKVEEW